MEQEDLKILNEYQDIQHKLKILKVKADELKPDVIEIMEDYDLQKYEGDIGVISYTKQSSRTSIDSEKLKKDLPDVATKYSKVSVVKPGIRFKVIE